MQMIFIISVAVTCMAALIGCRSRSSLADKIVMVQAGDNEMEAAGNLAKSEFPLFWRRFSNPVSGDDAFSVKVPISDKNGTEYFWLADIKLVGDKVSGVVDQAPQIVKCIQVNQRVEVPASNAIDWLFMANGKMKGNFTLRPLLKSATDEERQKLLSIIDSNPSIAPAK